MTTSTKLQSQYMTMVRQIRSAAREGRMKVCFILKQEKNENFENDKFFLWFF